MRRAALAVGTTLLATHLGGCLTAATDAPRATWGGIVALVNASTSDLFLGQFCGGIAMSPTEVVTALHCVDGRRADTVDVVTGVTDLCDPDELGHSRVGVAQVTPLPGTGGLLARLVLEHALDEAPPPELSESTAVVAYGWGRSTVAGVAPCELRSVALEQVAADVCGTMGEDVPSADRLCTVPAAGSNTCDGDSGGPVYVRGADGRVERIAVTVTGFGCGPDSPGLNVFVDAFLDAAGA